MLPYIETYGYLPRPLRGCEETSRRGASSYFSAIDSTAALQPQQNDDQREIISKVHIVHVIRDLDSASGGPSRSMPALARRLSRNHADIQVTTVYQDRGNVTTVDPSTQFQAVRGGTLLGPFRIRDRLADIHRRTPINTIHLHGLWSPSIHLSARFARQRGIPYVITPRGMLSSWCLNNKSLRKQIAWRTYQQHDLNRAACVHATSQNEAADVQAAGITSDIAMIPHGCDLPPAGLATTAERSQLAVCLTRLHPVKGLSDLLDAWAAIRPTQWQLIIAGPDHEGYRDQLINQLKRLDLSTSVQISDALDGDDKWQLLSAAGLSISASHSENFGMSIAESLAAGTPVITTEGTPWKTVADHNCGWWVPVGSNSLGQAIHQATSLPSSDLSAMGRRGAELVRTEYSWDAIAERMKALYGWLVDRSGEPPADVMVK